MAPFALPQRGFRSHPLGHVAPDRGHEHPLVRSPARERNIEVSRLALLAAADDLQEAFRVLDVDAVADKGGREIAVPLKQNVDLLTQQLGRGVAEDMFRGAVEPLDRPVETGRDDRVGRGIDDGVIARVLPFAQDALARHRYGDVIDLQAGSELALPDASGRTTMLCSSCCPASSRSGSSVLSECVRMLELPTWIESSMHGREPGFAQVRKDVEEIFSEH